ncbi:MAG: SIS domain-containing protein [Candidatus Nanopelagicales bacterium]|jgi:D-sedoheptulose 7-phosphate isomerase|nr:SIS domain-containing protein [Candidatus Nanopelagicales bacterium]
MSAPVIPLHPVDPTHPAPGDPLARAHRDAVAAALAASGPALDLAASWGRRLAALLPEGARLLAAGNGGSAAEAQHLTAELVGRFRGERPPFSALALHADTSSVTAIVNDYGVEELFARQVQAHGSPGDVLVLLSTSGRSPNLLAAADRANALGLVTWALTGPLPNPLAERCAEAVAIPAATSAAVQEVHLVAVHVLCLAFDSALPTAPAVLGGAR